MKLCGRSRRPWVNSEHGHSVLGWVRLCDSKCNVWFRLNIQRYTFSVLQVRTNVYPGAFKRFFFFWHFWTALLHWIKFCDFLSMSVSFEAINTLLCVIIFFQENEQNISSSFCTHHRFLSNEMPSWMSVWF